MEKLCYWANDVPHTAQPHSTEHLFRIDLGLTMHMYIISPSSGQNVIC